MSHRTRGIGARVHRDGWTANPTVAKGILVFAVAVSLVAVPTASAFNITEISATGVTGLTASAVNNAGQVAGTATFPGISGGRAFRWQDGVFTNLGLLSAPSASSIADNSVGSDINNSGQVVGWSTTSDSCFIYRGVVWTGTAPTGIDGYPLPNNACPMSRARASKGFAINDAGYVTGISEFFCQATNTFTGTRGFLALGGGPLTDLTPPCTGSRSEFVSAGLGVNASQSVLVDRLDGYLDDQIVSPGGAAINVPVRFGGNSTSRAVGHPLNDAGAVVGPENSNTVPFPSSVHVAAGVSAPLKPLPGYPGYPFTWAGSIDNRDESVGYVSSSRNPGPLVATRWTGTTPTDLNSLLDPGTGPGTGWYLNNAQNISADGSKIIGTGTHNGVAASYLLDIGQVELSVNNVSVDEPRFGSVSADFKVTLNRASSQTVTVNYATQDGEATAAENDYTPTSGTLTFAPGETQKTVSVAVNYVGTPEGPEAFFLVLSGESGATVSNHGGIGGISGFTLLPGMSGANPSVPSPCPLCPPGQTLADAIGRLYDIKGHVYLKRGPANELVELRNNDPLFVGDVIVTDKDSVAAFELLIGGRIGVKKGTTVLFYDEGEVRSGADGEKKIVLKSGGIWAKFAKQKEPLTIETSGGVMGIKG